MHGTNCTSFILVPFPTWRIQKLIVHIFQWDKLVIDFIYYRSVWSLDEILIDNTLLGHMQFNLILRTHTQKRWCWKVFNLIKKPFLTKNLILWSDFRKWAGLRTFQHDFMCIYAHVHACVCVCVILSGEWTDGPSPKLWSPKWPDTWWWWWWLEG